MHLLTGGWRTPLFIQSLTVIIFTSLVRLRLKLTRIRRLLYDISTFEDKSQQFYANFTQSKL